MKKIFLILFFMFGIATCATANISAKSFDGFYIGAAGGGSFINANENISITDIFNYPDNDTLHNSSLFSDNDLLKNSPKGAVYAGFGHAWQAFYLGAEAFASFSNYHMTSFNMGSFNAGNIFSSTITVDDSTIKLNPFEYGVDLRPGLLLSPITLLYGRVGVAINKLVFNSHTLAEESYFPPIFVTEILPITLQSSASKTESALRLGMGLEQKLNQWLSIRADYIYTNYGNIAIHDSVNNTLFSVNRGITQINLTNNSHAKISDNTVMVGLSYYFLNPAQFKVIAEDSTCNQGSFTGFYAGAEGGGSFTNGRENISAQGNFTFLDQDNFLEIIPFNGTNNLKTNSLTGALYAGYGLASNPFYLSAEIFTDISDYKMHVSDSFSSQSTFEGVPTVIEMIGANNMNTHLEPLEYGIDLRPGLLLTPSTLIYARIGTAINKLFLESNSSTKQMDFAGFGLLDETLPLSLSSQASKRMAAMRLGGGIEQHISQHLSVRADYIYTDYGNIGAHGSNHTLINSINSGLTEILLTNNTRLKVSNNKVMLGLSYYF